MSRLGQLHPVSIIITLLTTTACLATPIEEIFRRAIGDVCVGTHGKGGCRPTAACRGISYREPFCPNDPDDIQCCVEIPCQVNGGSGFCRSISNNGCPGGSFYAGSPPNWPCPGSQDIQCCIPEVKKGVSSGTPVKIPASCNAVCQTDKLLFEAPLSQFLAARNNKQPPYLNWYSNGCYGGENGFDWVPDAPGSYNFVAACYRHDFGYAQYRAQNRFTQSNRKLIDDVFLDDLLNLCASQTSSFVDESVCAGWASLYYQAVRRK